MSRVVTFGAFDENERDLASFSKTPWLTAPPARILGKYIFDKPDGATVGWYWRDRPEPFLLAVNPVLREHPLLTLQLLGEFNVLIYRLKQLPQFYLLRNAF
jgi:hypothetical protein